MIEQFVNGVALGLGFAVGSALYATAAGRVRRAVVWLAEPYEGGR